MTWTCQTPGCPIHDVPQPNPAGKAEAWFYRHWKREHRAPREDTPSGT